MLYHEAIAGWLWGVGGWLGSRCAYYSCNTPRAARVTARCASAFHGVICSHIEPAQEEIARPAHRSSSNTPVVVRFPILMR